MPSVQCCAQIIYKHKTYNSLATTSMYVGHTHVSGTFGSKPAIKTIIDCPLKRGIFEVAGWDVASSLMSKILWMPSF